MGASTSHPHHGVGVDDPGSEPVDYARVAPDYDARYALRRYAGTEATLRTFVAAGQRVLDVGCGTGQWLQHMRAWGCAVIGLDPSAGMLGQAARRVIDGTLMRFTAVRSSGDVVPIARALIGARLTESLIVLALDTKNRVIEYHEVARPCHRWIHSTRR